MKEITFEVIAEYPDMILELGQLVTTYESGRAYVTEQTKVSLFDYPHLFKQIEDEKD
jgi:hypothetical protein